jgi:hypothetical protein
MPETPMRLTNESGEWEYVPLTDEELALGEAQAAEADLHFGFIRGERDGRLSACDWTDLPNAPLTAPKKAEWQTYRQELRDYPAQSDKVSTLPEWPTPPE